MIVEIFKLFRDSSEEMYEKERERLISDFFKEATFRDSIHHQRKVGYENYANAVVSMSKCRVNKVNEKLHDRKVDIESSSVIERENSTKKAMMREAITCAEIRNLVINFNKLLWPKKRLDLYSETVQRSAIELSEIETMQETIDNYLKSIAQLNKDINAFNLQKLLGTAQLKTEHSFMNRLVIALKEKIQKEDMRDNDRLYYLVSVCKEAKKNLNSQLEKLKLIQMTMKICLSLEKLSDRSFESSDEAFDGPVNILLRKLSRVEAECVLLRNFKKNTLLSNENFKARIEQESHDLGVRRNIAMLRLDTSPSVGTIAQISNQIHQIKSSVSLHKRFKLCKACKKHLAC